MEAQVLKLREIINLIDKGELNTEQSVQRRFVYKDVIVDTDLFGKMSKADKLVTDILSGSVVSLAPIWFYKNSETNSLNIHGGKQRILTLYNFIKGSGNKYKEPEILNEAEKKYLKNVFNSFKDNLIWVCKHYDKFNKCEEINFKKVVYI